MLGCVKMPEGVFPVPVPKGLPQELGEIRLPSRFLCVEGNDFFYVDGTEDEHVAELITEAFSAIPAPIRTLYLSGTLLSVTGRDEFEEAQFDPAQGFSGSMGVKILGTNWKLREDILSADPQDGLDRRLAYALASRVAADLKDEDGFDSRRFMAAFARVADARDGEVRTESFVKAPKGEVDRRHQAFVELLFCASEVDAESARELFRGTALGKGSFSVGEGAALDAKLGIQQPMNLKKLYQDFVGRGLEWVLPDGQKVSFVLQSASTRERPESSHRVYLYYSNKTLDGFLTSGANAIFSGEEAWISLTPGVVGSYDTRTPDGDKMAAMLAGALFDAGLPLGPGEVVLHSYLGLPVTVLGKGAGENGFDPEWELGVQFRGFKGRFFAGAMASVSILDPSAGYYGFALRIDL
ncbi:MAG TPA: hypothetical protein PLY45_00900 [bacterium]|nr:hypothetical protein [bacterium]